MQSPDPPKEEKIKEGLTHCHDCDGIKYRNRKTSTTLLIHLLMKQGVKKRTKFGSFEINICLFSSFFVFSLQ